MDVTPETINAPLVTHAYVSANVRNYAETFQQYALTDPAKRQVTRTAAIPSRGILECIKHTNDNEESNMDLRIAISSDLNRRPAGAKAGHRRRGVGICLSLCAFHGGCPPF